VNIEKRYERLLKRRAPDDDRTFYRFDEAYEKVQGVYTKYILGALRPVNQKYTQKLIDQGDRIENQLKDGLKDEYPDVNFRRQGSVSNLTHIKYSSDVDVLVITDKFHSVENPQTITDPYKGNPNVDLLNLRNLCKKHLEGAFPAATVDDTGSTAVSINGGSLYCKVDVVSSNWFNSKDYVMYNQEIYRGVEVLNKNEMIRNKNFPFLFNYRIDMKDKQLNGTTRMLIRLLKTIRADSDENNVSIDFSSFDICSIIYRYPESLLVSNIRSPLDIIRNLIIWMESIIFDTIKQNNLQVVDDSRKIFDKHNKIDEFKKLLSELKYIYDETCKENRFGIITEAHLS